MKNRNPYSNSAFCILGFAFCIFFIGPPACAQTRIVDLVPADAGGALFIRGVDALREKGDKLIADSKIANLGRPSQLFELVLAFLGIQGGVDGKLPIGILVANPGLVRRGNIEADFIKLLVAAVPFDDLDKVSAGFGFKPGQLKPGMMARGKGQNFGTDFFVDGQYLYIGTHADAVRAVVKQASFIKNLDAQQKKLLVESDLLLVLGKQLFDEVWRFSGVNEQQLIDGAKDDKEVVRELLTCLRHLRYFAVSIRIDNGVAGSLLTLFEQNKNSAVEKLLARLRGGGAPSSLAGLPEGQILAAQALQGDGSQNSAVARALLELVFRQTPYLKVFDYTQRPNLIAAFAELLQHLQGIRFAVYHNPPERGAGQLSAAAILQAQDAAKFIKDVKELAKLADSDALDLTEKTGLENVAMLRKLVADLGNEEYKVRQSATVRLKLVGERALPFLDAAFKSQELEVIKRAERIQDEIINTAAARRKELLSDDLFKRIKPSMLFSARPENWQGQEIYSAYLKLADADKKIEAQLAELLGPEWNRIRFAVHANNVAVVFGSNVELLHTTLLNLKNGKPGLAKDGTLAGFQKHCNPERNFEIHLATRRVMSLITPMAFADRQAIAANPAHTALALTVGAASVQIDLWLPPAELGWYFKAR